MMYKSSKWHKLLTVSLALIATVLAANQFHLNVTRSRFEGDGGQYTTSPDGRWRAYFESGATTDTKQSYLQVLLFDLTTPLHAGMSDTPIRLQEQNPTASIYVPLEIYARSLQLEWNSTSEVLRVTQPSMNSRAAMTYELNLKTYSWVKVDP